MESAVAQRMGRMTGRRMRTRRTKRKSEIALKPRASARRRNSVTPEIADSAGPLGPGLAAAASGGAGARPAPARGLSLMGPQYSRSGPAPSQPAPDEEEAENGQEEEERREQGHDQPPG